MSDLFIVRTLPRSGSHLLRGLLSAHPQVDCLGEIFNPLGPPDQQAHAQDLENTAELFERLNDRAQEHATKVGFVCHSYVGYDHPVHPAGVHSWEKKWASLWQVAQETNVPIIRLYRSNAFLRYLSLMKARHLNQWQLWKADGVEPEHRSVSIDPIDLAAFLKDTETFVNEWHLATPAAIDIDFDDLVAQPSETANAVFQMLGVPPLEVKPATLRTSRSPEIDCSNYDALKAEFAGTRFEKFFT
ncbi:MAG: sulfotransferase [Verrucomicrobiota bacterium]